MRLTRAVAVAAAVLVAGVIAVVAMWQLRPPPNPGRAGARPDLLEGHTDQVVTLAYSPDGQTLASGGHDRTVRVWDLRTGREKFALPKSPGSVLAVAFSVDGGTVASACLSDDGMIRLWDARTGERRAALKGHVTAASAFRALAYSPDGETLASEGRGRGIQLWNTKTYKEKAWLSGHGVSVYSLAYSPDGGTLASGGDDGRVKLWDTSEAGLQTCTYTPTSVASLAGGVGCPSLGRLCWLPVALGGGLKGRIEEPEPLDWQCVAFGPGGKTLAIGSQGGKVRLWDLGERKVIYEDRLRTCFAVAVSPNGKTLAAATEDDTMKLWDTATGKPRPKKGRPTGYRSVVFSPDGKTLALGTYEGTIQLVDMTAP